MAHFGNDREKVVAEAAAWQEKSSGIDRGEGEGGGRVVYRARNTNEKGEGGWTSSSRFKRGSRSIERSSKRCQ